MQLSGGMVNGYPRLRGPQCSSSAETDVLSQSTSITSLAVEPWGNPQHTILIHLVSRRLALSLFVD